MAESQSSGGPTWWRRHWLLLLSSALGLLVLVVYVVLAIRLLPAWIVSMEGAKAGEDARLKAIVDPRGALLGVLVPVVVAIGAVAAFLNYRETSAQNRRTVELSRETLDVTRRGQLTERFTKAIEQLGQTEENKLDIRLGGIYALEQIAKESAELHRPVMEILTAFLREHTCRLTIPSAPVEDEVSAARQADRAATEGAAPLRADFQAIATVLGRREVSHEPDGFRLDLGGVVLNHVDFRGAQLRGANFYHAQLQRADFYGAQLQRAHFGRAQLREAKFFWAELQAAKFPRAQLQGALFLEAKLESANFAGTSFVRRPGDSTTDTEAHGLTWRQLSMGMNVDKAILPDYVIRERQSQPDDPIRE